MYEFNEDDLKSNQRGFISARQKDWLRSVAGGIKKSPRVSSMVAAFFLLLGLCMIFGMFLSNESSRNALLSNPLNIVCILAIIPVVLAFLGLSFYLGNRQSARLLNPVLLIAEGMVRLDQEYSPNAGFTSYYVYIDKVRFGFSEDMSGIFQEGRRYRVFYVESMMLKFIISHEEII